MHAPGETPTPDDQTLMRRVAERDGEALRALYDRHGGVVFAIALSVLHDRSEAEQLLVDVFEEAWERFDRFDASRGSTLAYLATLARSRAIDRLRAKPRERSVAMDESTGADPVDATPGPLSESLTHERSEMVTTALASLDPLQRDAVRLAFFEGLSHSEIADKLGKPLGTVKTHIRQGLIRMRSILRTEWQGTNDEEPGRP